MLKGLSRYGRDLSASAIAELLSEFMAEKDRYTWGHTQRVVFYAEAIARRLGLEEEQLKVLKLGALLHDIGKIGIDDRILKKPEPLTEAEWQVMQTHPELGFEILDPIEVLRDVIGVMKYHHERWDGRGYPLRLQGEEIPLCARIVAVADTYDAMVSTRPYRKGLAPKLAYDEIVSGSGSQFDPAVVEAFVFAFERRELGRGSGVGFQSPRTDVDAEHLPFT